MSSTASDPDFDSPFEQPLQKILPRIFVWGMLFLVLYILRSFFLLIFLTFVFSYVLARMSDRLAAKIPPRTLRVVLVTLVFLGILWAIGAFIIPNLRAQAETFASQFSTYIRRLDQQLLVLEQSYPQFGHFLPTPTHHPDSPDWNLGSSPTVKIAQSLFGNESQSTEGDASTLKETVRALSQLGSGLVGIASAFLLSLLFSFLIVLDLPNLTKSVQGLRETSVRFVYDEVAPGISKFASVLGRALEAQLLIAILNTILTVLGLYLLGLSKNVAFIAVIVFLCSFIPVAGVFISSAPICLMALEEYGVHMMFVAAGLITVIHMIEAYILNPRIYGHHLHMNPVLVLIILTIGGKLFHVWGLVLGVPVCTYIFGHAIRPRRNTST